MIVLEKIISSFVSPPGLFLVIWVVITVYLIKKRSNRLIVGLACISLVLMYILSSAVGGYAVF